jgi:hypothetical protein
MDYAFLRRFFVVWLIMPWLSIAGFAQQQKLYYIPGYAELYESVQQKYGLDQELINGIFFEYPYWKALGHPFLGENQFCSGTLVYRQKRYENIRMKYDIYEQDLLINYHFDDKQMNILLVKEFISEFSFNDKIFKYFALQGMLPGFYQVISEDSDIKCLYYWFKERRESYHNRTYSSYEFSGSSRKNYLLIGDKPVPYKNNRTFIHSFNADVQEEIRKFMKLKKIKVKKCNDSSMLRLMDFCNAL